MAEFQAGEVVVPVVPDASGIINSLRRQLVPAAAKVGREMQQSIAAQMKRIDIPVSADTTRARAAVQELSREAQRASGQQVRIGAQADTGAAQAAMAALDGTVSRLDGRRAGVRVDADTAGAQAGMAATDASVSRVDGRTAHVRVDADVAGALAGIAAVSAALAALPAAAAVGLGAAGLAGAAVTAGVGIAALSAVAIPSLSRINEALKAQETAANSAARGLSNAAGATRNLVIEQAQAQIAQLQAANAADQLRQAQDRVKDAVAGVSQAKDRLKSAVQAAAQAQVSAAQRATSAERSLADAQRQALRAQEDLNRARAEAIKHLQDVARTLRGNALDQRQAALDLKEAEADLAKARRSGNADEIERASIAYERTQLRVEELKAEQERLNEEQAKGVEGNDRVVSAKEQVEAANRRVIDAERDLAKAYEEAGKAGEEAAKRVADARKAVRDAEDRVDDAKAALERVKRDQKIAKLQEKIRAEQAKQAAKQAARASATQATAAQKTADLSPAEQAAAQSIKAFKESYERFQKDLGTSVLPVITGGLKVIESLFKPLTPLIKGTADSLVGLEDSARKALGGPFWKDFFDQLSKQAPGVVEGLGKSFGNIIEGIAGIIRAFLPFSGTVVGGIEKATSAFATWGKNLQSNPGFQKFISFAQANIPKVVELFKNIGSAIGSIISALAPFGSAALSGLSALVGWIGKLSPSAIQAIALAIGGIVLGVKAWAIAQRVLNVVLSKNPIGLIITAIGLLVAGLTYAYQNSETFRSIVDAAFKAIGVAAQWLWTNVLQPVFNGLVWLWQNVIAPAVTWLWQNVLKPAWDGIAAAIEWAWTNVIQPAVAALVLYWQTILGPVITWLYENVVKPAWDAISTAIQWAWQNIVKPAVAALVLYWQKVLGPVITWLWNNIVKPAWDGISAAVKFAWNNIIKPAVAALVLYWQTILGPAITWLWEKVIKPAWNGISEAIKFAWEKIIQPAVKSFWTFISETLPEGFKKGVGMIEKFWNGLKDVAKKPVNFVIETVYNQGIVKLWNTVADALGLKDLKLSPLPALARGGILPGTSSYRQGDDQLVAMRRGEGVYVSEAMRDPYERARLHAVNRAAISGKSLAPFQGFQGLAGGGIVGDLLASGVKFAAEKLMNPILDQASKAMGGSPWGNMLLAWPKKMVGDVIKFLEAKEAAAGGPGAQKALAFAREQIGKPYKFGATGPGSFDCSGLTMRAWQAGGRSDIPRTSQQQMGWVKQIGKPVPGALGFPHPGHVWLYVSPDTIIEAPQTGLNVRQVAARAAQVIGVPPTEYDSGGYLPTGHSLVYNGTGSPEPVLTDQQWQAMQGATQGGDGSMVRIDEFHATPEQSPQAIARELYWLSKSRPR
ncbi:NlpC/P60 family protein [Nonomuraea wenchangensis]